MADFRRFYNPGLEHVLHLEDLQRSASRSKIKPLGPRQDTATIRRWLAASLKALAERIDPIGGAHDSKPKEVTS